MNDYLEKAFALAEHWYAEQSRKNSITIIHPIKVACVLRGWGVEDKEVIAAAYTHTLLENTGISEQEISEQLGEAVLKRVKMLTHNTVNISKADHIANIANSADIFTVLIKAAAIIIGSFDFVAIGNVKYAKMYLDKAESVFSRIETEKSILGKIYDCYIQDKNDLDKLIKSGGL